MSPKSHQKLFRLALLLLSGGAFAATGCTNGSLGTTTTTSGATGPAYVIGTDAPVAAVTSFSVQIMGIDAINSSGTSVPLMSGQPTVDFARYNGLQTLLDMNDVPQGTYDQVVVSLGTGTIGYLNTGNGAPTIETEAATFTSPSVTVTLDNPLVVQQNGSPAGLRVDFDLRKSIQVDSNGNITGTVDPTFNINSVNNNDTNAHIDTLIAGVVSVDATSQSFVVQGPHGENFTIDVNGQTEWDGDASLSMLTTSCIVEVSGTIDHADQTLDADEVAVLSTTNFYAAGQVTYVTETAGQPASSFDLYVRGLLPTNTGLTLGQIAQVNLSGNEKFFIYWMHNPFTEFLFNSSAMVAGQPVAVGGPASGASNPDAVTVERIHLRNWGFNGTIVAGSQNASQDTFQMQVNGFAGVLIPETVTVYLGTATDFRYGLGAWGDLTDGANIRVVGLLLKNPTTGQVVLLARHIDGLSLTDFTTAAFE